MLILLQSLYSVSVGNIFEPFTTYINNNGYIDPETLGKMTLSLVEELKTAVNPKNSVRNRFMNPASIFQDTNHDQNPNLIKKLVSFVGNLVKM